MRYPTPLLLMCWMATACAQQPATLWTFDGLDRIGKYAMTASGSPSIVKEKDGRSICFRGEPDAALLSVNPIADWCSFTIEAWIKPRSTGAAEQRFLHIEDERAARVLLELRIVSPQAWALDTFLFDSPESRRTLLDRTKLHSTDEWHWVALTYDGKTMAHYVDGVRELEGELSFRAMAQGRMSLGVRLNKVSWYQGCIREIRFAPRALAAHELQKRRDHRWRRVPSPDIHNVNTPQRNFASSALATDFLVQSGRTYFLGVVARVQAVHNVTSSDGKILPNDGTKFKL